MKGTDIRRIIRTGFINFGRNGIVSFASVLVVTITLSLVTSLIFLQAILKNSLSEIQSRVDVTVYFVPGTAESKVQSLQEELEKLPEVKTITYTSDQQALQDFRERHQNDYLTLQALDELSQNPLGASLNIKAKDSLQYESIVRFLNGEGELLTEAKQYIDKINYNQNKVVIDRLNSLITAARQLGALATAILMAIAVIVTFNTIRLTIYYSREEIGVMRLVGAGNAYIRGPFVVEGILYGVVGTLLTLVIFVPISLWLGRNMADFLKIDLTAFYFSYFFQIAGILLLSGITLGTVSSVFAIRKYLRK